MNTALLPIRSHSRRISKQPESGGDGRGVSREGMRLILACFQARKALTQRTGSGCHSKITERVKLGARTSTSMTNEKMMRELLCDNGIDMSLSTIIRCREILGWAIQTWSESCTCTLG